MVPSASFPVEGEWLRFIEQSRLMMYLADPLPTRPPKALSRGLARALGYRSRARVPLSQFWRKHLHPDDRERVMEAWAAGSSASYTVTYRLLDRESRILWVQEQSVSAAISSRVPALVHAVLLDVSDRLLEQERLNSLAHDLTERVKELDCLYAISDLSADGDIEEVLRRVARILPRAWQFPERAHCRIVYGQKEYVSDNRPFPAAGQTANIVVSRQIVGRVEVGYRDASEEEGRPSFLTEEYALLKGIARRLADAIEKRESAAALGRSERMYRTLARNLPHTLVGLYDRNLRCTVAEGSLGGTFDKRRLEGRSLDEVWRKDAWMPAACRAVLEGHEHVDERRRGRATVSFHAVPVIEGKTVTGGIFVVRDVTERRSLEREVMDVASREQRRFGQDLHDGLGQLLSGLMLLTGSLARDLAAASPEFSARAEEIAHVLRQAMTEMKSLTRSLVPIQLDRRGLTHALQELARDCENLFHVACRCECREEGVPFEPDAAAQVYRIAQEAVSNAARHGGATEIRVTLEKVDGLGRLHIEDNGRGFSPRTRSHAGMGLRIMRYRAEMIGGTLSVEARPGRGARIVCLYPLRENRDKRAKVRRDAKMP